MNIELRPRLKEHVVTFYNKTQDKEIQKFFPFSTNSIEQALDTYHESLKTNASSYGKVIYINEEYIGDIWCYSIDLKEARLGMLSIVIFDKAMWNKGISTKTANIFIREVFCRFDIDKIGAFTYSYNNGCIKLLKKLKFTEAETFIEDGIESIYFEISRELFNKTK